MARVFLSSCLLLSIACGPSIKQAQTSTERFERCYGADFDPTVALEQRHRCWSHWLDARVETDSPERVRYARMRLAQLASDPSPRLLPNPTPSPPKTYEHEYPRSPPGGFPSSACTPLCNDKWALCNGGCPLEDEVCVTACEASYRICIGGCP